MWGGKYQFWIFGIYILSYGKQNIILTYSNEVISATNQNN